MSVLTNEVFDSDFCAQAIKLACHYASRAVITRPTGGSGWFPNISLFIDEGKQTLENICNFEVMLENVSDEDFTKFLRKGRTTIYDGRLSDQILDDDRDVSKPGMHTEGSIIYDGDIVWPKNIKPGLTIQDVKVMMIDYLKDLAKTGLTRDYTAAMYHVARNIVDLPYDVILEDIQGAHVISGLLGDALPEIKTKSGVPLTEDYLSKLLSARFVKVAVDELKELGLSISSSSIDSLSVASNKTGAPINSATAVDRVVELATRQIISRAESFHTRVASSAVGGEFGAALAVAAVAIYKYLPYDAAGAALGLISLEPVG